ncbi:MAG: hypothetical protein RL087_506, partial [Pseudomonadota bacterium]
MNRTPSAPNPAGRHAGAAGVAAG